MDTLKVLKEIKNAHSDYILALEFTSCAKYLFSVGLDNMIKIWVSATFEQYSCIETKSGAIQISINSDHSTFLTISQE
jgi:WD40 repeat protein